MITLTENQITEAKELLNFIQTFAREWMPDEEGILEEEEQERIIHLINISFDFSILNKDNINELCDTFSELTSFGWEWFPEEGLDEEDIKDSKTKLEQAEKFYKELISLTS